jgi:outer membrane lipoprotein SlyB
MKIAAITAAGLAAVMALASAPMAEAASTTRHKQTVKPGTAGCEAYRHKKAKQGTLTGAVAGGVLGNVVAGRGARTEGTLIGAGVGAVAGHEISSNKARSRCR